MGGFFIVAFQTQTDAVCTTKSEFIKEMLYNILVIDSSVVHGTPMG